MILTKIAHKNNINQTRQKQKIKMQNNTTKEKKTNEEQSRDGKMSKKFAKYVKSTIESVS